MQCKAVAVAFPFKQYASTTSCPPSKFRQKVVSHQTQGTSRQNTSYKSPKHKLPATFFSLGVYRALILLLVLQIYSIANNWIRSTKFVLEGFQELETLDKYAANALQIM